jgi:hypothetical protein
VQCLFAWLDELSLLLYRDDLTGGLLDGFAAGQLASCLTYLTYAQLRAPPCNCFAAQPRRSEGLELMWNRSSWRMGFTCLPKSRMQRETGETQLCNHRNTRRAACRGHVHQPQETRFPGHAVERLQHQPHYRPPPSHDTLSLPASFSFCT